MTTSVRLNPAEIQKQLYLVEMKIWAAQDAMKNVGRVGTYMDAPFAQAEAALEMAHAFIGKIRENVRKEGT